VTPEAPTSPGGVPDPLAKQLLSQAQEIARLKATLDKLAEETSETVANLLSRVESVEDSTEPGSSKAGPVMGWCWREIGPRGAEALWQELTSWVRWIRHRYPLARRIPPCWSDHPEIVEELTALWLAWQAAYTEPDASLTAAADWHDRWLPGLLYRIEHGPLALDCSVTHHDRPTSAYADAQPTDVADVDFVPSHHEHHQEA
jgi:hypothetical protein